MMVSSLNMMVYKKFIKRNVVCLSNIVLDSWLIRLIKDHFKLNLSANHIIAIGQVHAVVNTNLSANLIKAIGHNSFLVLVIFQNHMHKIITKNTLHQLSQIKLTIDEHVYHQPYVFCFGSWMRSKDQIGLIKDLFQF